MIWLIQDTSRNFSECEKEVHALDTLGFKWKSFGIPFFTARITGLEETDLDEPVIIRGGTKIIDMIVDDTLDFQIDITDEQRKNFKEGIFYSEQGFDQAYYSKLDIPLLNSNSESFLVKDILDDVFENDAFVKPSNDRKSFTAGIIDKGMTLRTYINQSMYQEKFINDTVLVSYDLYNIKRECRFYCINDRVITGSHYRINDGTKHFPIKVDDVIWKIADEYVKLYQPANVFVMDIVQVGDEYKIVEYNCFNASGLYSCDAVKLFDELQNLKQ